MARAKGRKNETKEPVKEEIAQTNEEPVKEEIKTLFFKTYGWCEELNKMYDMGFYKPKTLEEFKILSKYGRA